MARLDVERRDALPPGWIGRRITGDMRHVKRAPVTAPPPLKREGWMALDDLLDQARRLAGAPQGHVVADPVDEQATVRAFRALERARDADELGLERVGADPHGRIAMAA